MEPTQEQLALRAQIKAEYPYLIDREAYGKKISHAALGAKNVKRMLSHAFDEIAFKVGSGQHAGWCSIFVEWSAYHDAPTVQQVDSLIRSHFGSVRFDGMNNRLADVSDPWRCAFQALFGSASHIGAQGWPVGTQEEARRCQEKLERSTAPSGMQRGRGMRL